MKRSTKRTAAGVGTLALAGGTLLTFASAALAVTAPPWVATEQANHEFSGTIKFFDASGNQVVTGATTAGTPLAKYAVASGGMPGASTSAAVYVAATATGDPSGWGEDTISSAVSGPTAGLPAPVAALQTAGDLVVPIQLNYLDAATAGGSSLTGFTDTYEVRILGTDPSTWYSADIQISGTGNSTWTETYPDAPVPADHTSVTISSPTSGTVAPSGTTSVNVTGQLSDTDNAGTIPTGSVHLFNGTSDLGAATVSGSGAVSKTATVADGGSYSFTFQYTPTGNFLASSSSAVAYSVHAAATGTTVTVGGPTTGTVGTPITYTAAVSPAGAPGTVKFFVDGTQFASATVANAASPGVTYTPADTSAHAITATYTSSDPANFASQSTSNVVTVTAGAAQYTPDPQNVTVSVPAGTKTISTPYTATHPLDLGTLVLSADGTHYDSATPTKFGDPSVAAVLNPGNNLDGTPAGITTNGVTITDTEAGSTGWTAHLRATTDFISGPNSIDSSLLEFLNVAAKYIPGNNISPSNAVTVANVANVKAGGDFATKSGAAGTGVGTVAITGTLDLHGVPTSTPFGTYTATLTFTIS